MKKIRTITVVGLASSVMLVAAATAHAATTGLANGAEFGSLVLASIPLPSPGAVALAVVGGLIIARRNKTHVQR